jgi:indolepyruvate ferredoxin oxidoreductase beta subunit
MTPNTPSATSPARAGGDSADPAGALRLRIFLSGVGGQGSITATLVIGEAATAAGLNVLSSEIHGMAQRGGIVETTVLLGDVHGPMIADGEADVLIGFEPVETLRYVRKIAPGRSIVLMNEHPVIPFTVSLGQESYPDLDEVTERLRAAAGRLVSFDAVTLAAEAGTAKAVGAVMIGALAGLELAPIPYETWTEALLARVPPKHRETNILAFHAGWRQTGEAEPHPPGASRTHTPPSTRRDEPPPSAKPPSTAI